MKTVIAGLLLSLAACGGAKSGAGAGGSTTPSGDVGSLSLKNASSYDIYSIQLAPYDDASWGQNLLGDDPLLHGETAAVAVVDCKKYDLRMVDDENVECVIQDIDLCFEDKEWDIDNSVLAACATGWAD
jgi:hypothetical protein